jgi:hypothetical protein
LLRACAVRFKKAGELSINGENGESAITSPQVKRFTYLAAI